jgi:hypothetical protein
MTLPREKRSNRKQDLLQLHFVHHKSHMHWPGNEHATPRYMASDNRLRYGRRTVNCVVLPAAVDVSK